jgi:hypothetical protein
MQKNCMLFLKEHKDDTECMQCGRSRYAKVVNEMEFLLPQISGSSTLGTTGHRLWPKILDMTGSLQRQKAREPYALY